MGRNIDAWTGPLLIRLCAAVIGLVAVAALIQSANAAGSLSQRGATPAPVTASISSNLAAQQQAAAIAAQSQNELSNIATALQAMQTAQTAARNAAATAPSTVADGLSAGGLVPDSGLARTGIANPVRDWSGADTPTQTTSGGLTNVTINQTAAQAILSWNEFNVGKNTTVTFNQPTSNSVALNQIAAGGTPSQILGAISARGQVYLIDPNGIIFGGTSQINVGALLASSASISAAQFTANGIYSPLANNIYSPSFTNAGGPVTVQEGAQINTAAPSSVTTGGGFVLLMGTTVSNAGAITTPDGQTELAAGDNFLLRPGYSTSSNQSSTTRGNEIAVQLDKNGSSLTGGSGAVSNDGVITADTGDITLAGETVAQNGVLAATTSLNVRGTIHLLASASDPFSNVSLGGDSVTLISPDLASTATALDSQRAALIAQSAVENAARALQANKNFDDLGTLPDQEENSRIEITAGNTVEFQGGSQTVAQGGQIAVSAVNRIQTDTGALLDVAGTYGVALPVSANDIAVSIQGFETRDNPQNRLTQNLRNSTVYIDRRDVSIVPAGAGGYATARAYIGGGVLEVSGYLNTTGHTIGEWTSLGGSIAMQTGATGAIVAQSGATFNIDGGSIQYQPGLVDQSYLLGENGIVYNVNTAPAYITYAGVFDGFVDNHAAWSVSQTYANVLSDPAQIREPGYTQGRAAGSLTLDSPTTLFGATIDAAVVNGPAQTASAPAGITDPYMYSQNIAAEPGTLVIGSIGNGTLLAGSTDVTLSGGITAQTEADSATVNSKIAASLAGTTDLNAAAISQSALGGLDVLTNGKIAVTAPVTLAPGAAVSLFGSAVTIAANITDPSGAVAAGNVIDIGGTQIILAQADAHNKKTTTGDIVLARNAVIDTEGLWTNLALDPTGPNHSAFENGGAVSLVSAADLKLAAGSRIDASSGAVIAANGAPTGGAGGAISLKLVDPKGGIAVGDLSLQGRLVSTGFTEGGALTLDAPNFDIGAARASADPSIVDLQPAFFQAGFSSYTLNGQVKVAPGTAINVVEPTEQFTTASTAVPTGGPVASGATLALLPLYTANTQFSAISQRPGASLTLAGGTSLTIGAGAALTVDPGQSIDLSSYGQMTIDGDLTAPGGAINLTDLATVNSIVPVKTYEDGKILSVWIGAASRISTAGLPFTAAKAAGESVAIAPAGGAINITGNDAVVLIQPGAILDASGTQASEQPNPRVNPSPILGGMPPNEPPIRLASAGGTIALASDNGLFLYGTMLAPAGGPHAAGGTLSLTLASDDTLNAQNLPDASRILTITQKDIAPPLPATLKPGTANKALVQGSGQISVAQIEAGGFGTLSFSALDAFIFHGNVTLSAAQSITLAQGVISDSAAAGSVTLNAPYVMLNGTINEQIAAGGQDYSALTVSGYPSANSTGAFTVNAGLIDVQNAVGFGGTETVSAGAGTQTTALEGFATVNLASTGDLRFLAPSVDSAANPTPQTSLISTGNVNLTAGVIFAANAQAANTATVIAGYSPVAIAKSGNFLPTGILTINRAPGAAPAEPYDIGGDIGFYAATILDSGVVWNPLGTIRFGSTALANGGAFSGAGDPGAAISFLPGSFTSVSAAGLTIPYGGTTDGVTYQVGGTALAINGTAEYRLASVNGGVGPGSITLDAMQIDIAKGATLDLAGGGTFTGQGFISGEGGSTNVLTTPLLQVGAAGGVTQPSLSADPVYAIIAGPQAPVAPVQDYTQTGATGSTPGIGAQIIIPAGVPGLPAGRYTLLPASYALNPGGYRVEFDGAASLAAPPVLALPDGSYAVSGRTGVAGTDVTGELPAGLTITPAATVQNYATYDPETYAQFLVATAAKFGAIRPALPEDAGSLNLFFPGLETASLEDAGLTSFAPASGGAGGTLQISGAANNGVAPAFDIYGAAAPAAIPGTVDLSAAAIDAFDPAILDIGAAGGGNHAYTSAITVEQGATLSAARVTLTALNGGITLKPGAEIDTLGRGALFLDATTTGPYSDNGASVLDVGNGYLTYTNAGGGEIPGYGPITIDDGATIYSDGSIAFSTGAAVDIGVNATYGAAYLDLALPEINVGDPASVGANAAAGLTLTQAVLQRLTAGVPSAGVPAARILVLSASDSLNFFGSTGLDLSGGNVQLVINSPAIYGAGSAGDIATIKASTIVWNGDLVSSQTFTGSNPPGGVVTNGPGTGAGTLNFDAGTIIFGDSSLDRPNRNIPLNRLALGFSTVNLNATTEITANGTGTLSVYQAQALYGAPGTGGALTFNTPLLTGANEANMGFTAGGAINIAAAASETPASAPLPGAAGAEISLNAAAVTADSAIILPSGKLDIQAIGGIKFGAASNIDLEGAASTILGQPTYGAGGSLVAESATAGITQAAGGVINVSASGNNAGAVDLTADAGAVMLNGTLTGAAPAADTAGAFTIRAQTLPNFTGLNNALDAGGFFDLREFDIAEGDLTVGDGVRARTVNIAVNGGSLTVTGTIDANFGAAGSISLAAADNLVLAPSSVLAAQGTVLQTDNYGQPIEAANAPQISLTTATGELTLDRGATIDLASADGVARGNLELNVPRLGGAQSGDANILAADGVTISGAATITVNAFATYHGLPDPNGTASGAPDALITQAYLDQINTTDTLPFMQAAATNADLASRLHGLTANYGQNFHFRPGVQITSATATGDLTVQGDLDLSGYRYGPGVNPAIYGSGEPGVLLIRAGGNLNVYGSITDGFGKPISDVGTTYASGWQLQSGSDPYGQDEILPIPVTLQANSGLAQGTTVNYAVPITAGSFAAGSVAPVKLTVAVSQTTTVAFVATSLIAGPNGQPLFNKGSIVPAGTVLPVGTTIGIGGILPFRISVGPVTWPANTPFTDTTLIGSFELGVALSQTVTLLPGSIIPANSYLIFPFGEVANNGNVNTRQAVDGTQGQLYPLGQLLPAGDMSWSIALVGGADTAAADPTLVQPASALGESGNLTLADPHYGKGPDDEPIRAFSVIRTGTGALSLIAGGALTEASDYGIYTAGAQSPPVLNAAGANPYDLPQGLNAAGGTLLGKNQTALAALAADYQANYPDGGGNVLVSAQGNLDGFVSTNGAPDGDNAIALTDTDALGAWLWLQGAAGQAGAWWLEFGALEPTGLGGFGAVTPQLEGFQGIGTLGGGNVQVIAGGNANGLNLAVASTGRVLADGTLLQTGGGNLSVTIGGAINANAAQSSSGDSGGLIADLRGDTALNAGSIGTIVPFYQGSDTPANDPRTISPLQTELATISGGIDLAPGDGTVTVNARGDLVIDAAVNPGIQDNQTNSTAIDFAANGTTYETTGGGVTIFSLWSAATAVALNSAGGDIAPFQNPGSLSSSQNGGASNLYPPILSAVAQNGNIDFVGGSLELAPAADGTLDLLAAGSIYGGASNVTGTVVAISGADPSLETTPFNPLITVTNELTGAPIYTNGNLETGPALIAFGADTPTGALHDGAQPPAQILAGADIVGLTIGAVGTVGTGNTASIAYQAAMPFEIAAGRDIVASGSPTAPSVFLNLNSGDITSVTAGRDILESSFDIAGPGTLLVQAGRDIYQASQGTLDSVGPLFAIDPNNRDGGAGITVIAGAGATGPDYTAFANLYLNPASTLGLQDASDIISENDAKLLAYLTANFGYTGNASGAYARFKQLGAAQQDEFLLTIYFAMLNQSGLEFNQPDSVRAKSYALGRNAIAALFPTTGAGGRKITYEGDITMFGGSGIHTDFGGAIQTLTPGGQTIIGVEGATPPGSAGLITQGSGDIDIYAQGSVLLGESRVLTTFGGNILAWSEDGDINAGRGDKTTIDYTPLQRVYDIYGNVVLSPNVPSTGAGIGTLNPIPQVVAGNINLVAPLGTVDAGEAGIRVSGNLNIAAAHVLNGANIQVQGSSSGVPTAPAVNVGALTSAGNNAGAAAAAAAEGAGKTGTSSALPSIWIVEILGYGGDDGSTQDVSTKRKPHVS